MSHVYRFEIYPDEFNLSHFKSSEKALKEWFKDYTQISFENVFEVKYFLVQSNEAISGIQGFAEEVFIDSVLERIFSSESKNQEEYHQWIKTRGFKKPFLIDVGFRPGVTDNSAHAALEALKLLPALKKLDLRVSSGTLYYVEGEDLNADVLEKLAYEKLANFLLHKVVVTSPSDLVHNTRFKKIEFPTVQIVAAKSELINLDVSESELFKMNSDNCWALSAQELSHIKSHYKKLKRNPSDVEMEVIAQSWSEHCKHKIFSSEISYSEGKLPKGVKPLGDLKVDGIFKSYIKGATLKIKEERKLPWLISIFHDNAGIVRFDDTVIKSFDSRFNKKIS